MRTFFLLGILFSISLNSHAQNLLATNTGNSVQSTISKVENGTVDFSIDEKGLDTDTFMPPEKVTSYTERSYLQKKAEKSPKIKAKNAWRFGISGGYSRRLSKSHESISGSSYAEDLKNGHHFMVEGQYFFPSQNGLGITYSSFRSKSEAPGLKDDITVSYMGPTYYSRYTNNDKNYFLLGVSLGYLGYKDNAYTSYDGDFTLKGGTLGAMLDASCDIGIAQNFALGFGLILTTGVLSKVTYTDGINTRTIPLEEDSKEGLLRLDVKVGLRFYQ
ncbi:hypothetical protein DN752_19260 [Echinicola strongylocentroti]|uniref:Outer membrane protein beta-barrel domain-containing protein n=1 Tax=Echinicola strongylocentroti TaxID=1795355 RepID=A0A2Z4IP38_9BACT|nr:hypothetical protein [Echinicola strongylocentroti]AWW32103.1 hypothetical protein DN752_19260 [Echinicola strongylocentroti]